MEDRRGRESPADREGGEFSRNILLGLGIDRSSGRTGGREAFFSGFFISAFGEARIGAMVLMRREGMKDASREQE